MKTPTAPGPESFDHPAGRLLRGAACAHLGSAGQSGVAWNGEWKGIGAENLVANLEVGRFLGCLMDIFFEFFSGSQIFIVWCQMM